MKTKYLIVSLVGLFMLIGTGCEDNLNIPKQGNLGAEDDFYKTDDDALQASASLYLSWGAEYFNWYFTKNLLSDDIWCGGGVRGDNSSMEQLNEFTFGPDHELISGFYSGMYSIIYKANLIVDKLQPNSNVKKQCIAEAKFFRAWAHFELVSLFGTAPIVDHLLQPSEYRQANGNPEKTWAFVESDLNEAISSGALPSKSSVNDSETGIRVTKEVALAYLGKAQLFQKKYSEAAATFEKVISSEKYDLYKGNYEDILHAIANNSVESMLEVNLSNDSEKAWNQFGQYNNMLYLMTGWRYSQLIYDPSKTADFATGGYGFANPRKSLYDAFVAEEGENGYRLIQTIHTYEQMKAKGVTIPAGNYLYGNEGFFMWKNRLLKSDCIIDFPGFQALQYINLRVMRYAEVLLMAAEANALSGNQGKADTYYNEIRTRAKLSAISGVTMEQIKNEKRLELCLEGCRFQDLVRWGDAEKMLANQGKEIMNFNGTAAVVGNTNTTYGFKEKHKLLPIPAKELLLNKNMKQNASW